MENFFNIMIFIIIVIVCFTKKNHNFKPARTLMTLLISADIFFAVKMYITYKHTELYFSNLEESWSFRNLSKKSKKIESAQWGFVFPENPLLQYLYIWNGNPKQRRLVKFQVLSTLLAIKLNISKESNFSS